MYAPTHCSPSLTRDDRRVRRAVRVALGCVAALLTACVSAGPATSKAFIWAPDYVAREPGAVDATTRIGVGDLVSVQVFDNERMSAKGRVRGDGKMSIPLINDIVLEGRTPAQAAQDVERALREANLVLRPRVNVVIDEVQPVRVAVLGAVTKAGTYPLDPGAGVAEALAAAGGLNEFAHKDRIYVLRKVPKPVRIRFTFASLTDTGPSSAFRLRQGDVVVVE
jgi:polysaccharide biosynthesis/export protein